MPTSLKPIKPAANTIFQGDNLSLMQAMPSGIVDLCYVDPPFYSQRDYKNVWGKNRSLFDIDQEDFDGFKDSKSYFESNISTGAKGLAAYIDWLRARIIEIHRILKPTGVFFLHLDYHAVHYARVMLDEVFGYENFQNEIIWRRKTGSNSTSKPRKLPCNTDTILFYSKSSKFTFNPIYHPHDSEYVKKFYRFDDNDGRGPYRIDNLAAPSISPTLIYKYKGYAPPEKGWRYNLEKMKKMDAEGRIHFPSKKTGRLALKRYLKEMKGSPLENIWDDIGMLQHASKEKTGWSTQKPLALLERILQLCSNEGDVVFDCFAGSGTTLEAAHNLKRKWFGIEQSGSAVQINKKRFSEAGVKVNIILQKDLPTQELRPATKPNARRAA